MKKMKLVAIGIAALVVIGTAGIVYAADLKIPAEIAAGLTGKSVEEMYEERVAGKTYGTIAKDAGKLDEFQQQMLDQKKAILDQRVKEGTLTQQQADEIYNAIKSNQATCDGTGSAGMGRKSGAGFGRGVGMGNGLCGGIGFNH